MSDTPQVNPKSYGLSGQLRRIVEAANKSPDVVSMVVLGDSNETAEGAIVVLRGRDTVALFEQWAVRNRVLNPDLDDGLVAALNGK